MVLGVPSPQFPFDTYYQGKLQSSPKYVAGQALGNINIPDIINLIQQQKQKSMQQKALNQAMMNPLIPQDQRSMIGLMSPFVNESNAPQFMGVLNKMTNKGLTPYQSQSLDERKREFDERQKASKDIQAFREQMLGIVTALRQKGYKLQAKNLQSKIDEWSAQHWFLSGLGMGPTADDIPSDDNSDWKAEPAQ